MKLKQLFTDDDTLIIAVFDNGAMYLANEKSAATIEVGRVAVVTGRWRKEEPTGPVYTAYVEQCGGGRPPEASKLPLESNSELADALFFLLDYTWVGDDVSNDKFMSLLKDRLAE
jgi:hypothetical protein